jgi:hypothetical protein
VIKPILGNQNADQADQAWYSGKLEVVPDGPHEIISLRGEILETVVAVIDVLTEPSQEIAHFAWGRTEILVNKHVSFSLK